MTSATPVSNLPIDVSPAPTPVEDADTYFVHELVGMADLRDQAVEQCQTRKDLFDERRVVRDHGEARVARAVQAHAAGSMEELGRQLLENVFDFAAGALVEKVHLAIDEDVLHFLAPTHPRRP